MLAVLESYCECGGAVLGSVDGVQGLGLMYIAGGLSERRPHSAEQRSDYRKWRKKSYEDAKWQSSQDPRNNHRGDLRGHESLREIRKQQFYDTALLSGIL